MSKGHTRNCRLVPGPHVETTVSGIPNCLNYCEILIVGYIHNLQMWLRARVGDSVLKDFHYHFDAWCLTTFNSKITAICTRSVLKSSF